MQNIIRKMVSGPRIRMQDDEFDLDLTPITPRIFAMSFPAADYFQKWYRNNINDVATYIDKNHGEKFWIFNCSGRSYDKTPFKNKVTDYSWEDHHSPTMILLSEACYNIHQFLEADPENVIYVHCNAGKGRTGTLICCYLMFCGLADCAQNAITYYGWKRFRHGKGVTQPSQIRYVFYFEKIVQGLITTPRRVQLQYLVIQNLPQIKNTFRLQAQIYDAHDYTLLYQNPEKDIIERLAGDSIFITFKKQELVVCGNIFVKIMHLSRGGNHKLICRFALHTSFLQVRDKNDMPSLNQNDGENEQMTQQYQCSMDRLLVDPNDVAKNKGFKDPDFKIKLIFGEVCKDDNCTTRHCNQSIEKKFEKMDMNEQQLEQQRGDSALDRNLKELEKGFEKKNTILGPRINEVCKDCNENGGVDADEWKRINEIIRLRKKFFESFNMKEVNKDTTQIQSGKDLIQNTSRMHQIGIIQQFRGDFSACDYDQTLAQGNDENIYGRYNEIEILGKDIEFPDVEEYKRSSDHNNDNKVQDEEKDSNDVRPRPHGSTMAKDKSKHLKSMKEDEIYNELQLIKNPKHGYVEDSSPTDIKDKQKIHDNYIKYLKKDENCDNRLQTMQSGKQIDQQQVEPKVILEKALDSSKHVQKKQLFEQNEISHQMESVEADDEEFKIVRGQESESQHIDFEEEKFQGDGVQRSKLGTIKEFKSHPGRQLNQN